MGYSKVGEQRVKAGLCVSCGTPRGEDGTSVRCRSCVVKYRLAQAKKIRANIAIGLCKVCGTERGPEGTETYCRSCADKVKTSSSECKKILRAERLLAGQCKECGEVNDTKTQLCSKCQILKKRAQEKYKKNRSEETIEKDNARARLKHRHHVAAGTCPCCRSGAKKLEEVNLCEKCWYKQISRRATGSTDNWKYIKDLMEKQEHTCAYTGVLIRPGFNASLDHIVPKTHPDFPGEGDTGNLAWSHVMVNACKNAMTPEEFVDMCRKVLLKEDFPVSGCDVRELENRWRARVGRHTKELGEY